MQSRWEVKMCRLTSKNHDCSPCKRNWSSNVILVKGFFCCCIILEHSPNKCTLLLTMGCLSRDSSRNKNSCTLLCILSNAGYFLWTFMDVFYRRSLFSSTILNQELEPKEKIDMDKPDLLVCIIFYVSTIRRRFKSRTSVSIVLIDLVENVCDFFFYPTVLHQNIWTERLK